MSTSKHPIISAFVYGAGIPAFITYALLVEGFVLIHLWDWFLSEPFGLPRLGMLHACGISLIVGLMSQQFCYTPDGAKKERMTHILLQPWVHLTLGYIIHKGMSL